MSDIDLDAIRAREDNAAKGPWTVGKRTLESAEVYALPILAPAPTEDGPDDLGELAVIRYWAGAFQYPHADACADAEFIAHAREDIPALLAEVTELRAELDYERRSRFAYEERVADQVENLRAEVDAAGVSS